MKKIWGYFSMILALLFVIAVSIDALFGEIKAVKFYLAAGFMVTILIYSLRDWFKSDTYDSQQYHSTVHK